MDGTVDGLIGGVVSSILAVFLVEAWLAGRRRLRHRHLKRALPWRTGGVTVVCPAIPKSWSSDGSQLTIDDAVGLAHLLRTYEKLGVDVDVVAGDTSARSMRSPIVCLGGPVTNPITARLTADHVRYERREAAPGAKVASQYVFGDQVFDVDEDSSLWILCWLARDPKDPEAGVLLIWGEWGDDTTAAAYFLTTRPQHLGFLFRGADRRADRLLIGLRDRSTGYRRPPTRLIDLSAEVFAEPPAMPR